MADMMRRISKMELENCEMKKAMTNMRRDATQQRQQLQQQQASSSSSRPPVRERADPRADIRVVTEAPRDPSYTQVRDNQGHRPSSWEERSRDLSPADDDDTYSLKPPPKRTAYRGGSSGTGRKSRP